MRRHTLGIAGIILLILGIVGAALTALLLPGSAPTYVPGRGMMGRLPRSAIPSSGPSGGYATPGQRIYFTGVGSAGPIPRQGGIGMMAGGGCANCHGSDGRGGRIAVMMGGGIEVPDIRYATLTSKHGSEPAWTEAQIVSAIRDGMEPGGKQLNAYMPRWQMSDTDMSDLISYLKELR